MRPSLFVLRVIRIFCDFMASGKYLGGARAAVATA
jgi:hypothetical protein